MQHTPKISLIASPTLVHWQRLWYLPLVFFSRGCCGKWLTGWLPNPTQAPQPQPHSHAHPHPRATTGCSQRMYAKLTAPAIANYCYGRWSFVAGIAKGLFAACLESESCQRPGPSINGLWEMRESSCGNNNSRNWLHLHNQSARGNQWN